MTFSDDGLVKTRHLPDQLDHLAERIQLNSRSVFSSSVIFADSTSALTPAENTVGYNRLVHVAHVSLWPAFFRRPALDL